MGFKDFFAKGPQGRNDGGYYQQSLPSSSYMAATSATNRRYMESMSPNGLQSTYTLRQQPFESQRTMSLSNRSFRNSEVPRTMSMRSNVNQPVSRSMSMTATSLRPNRPGSINSRANSLTAAARAYQQPQQPAARSNQRLGSLTNSGSRSGSRVGSRANSLTNNLSNANSKIVKTTTLEKDAAGRTKSITTKTIERRGGKVKITTTTVVQPQPIEEDEELDDDLAELEHFDSHHGQNYDDPYNETGDLEQYDDDQYYDGQGQQYYEDEEENYYSDPRRNGAASAAAAALAGHPLEPRHPQRKQVRQVQARPQRQQQPVQQPRQQQRQQQQAPVRKANVQQRARQPQQPKSEVKFQDSHHDNAYTDDVYESYDDFYETEVPQQQTRNRHASYNNAYDDYEQDAYNEEEEYYEPEPELRQKPRQRQSQPPPQRAPAQVQVQQKLKQRPQSQPPTTQQQEQQQQQQQQSQPVKKVIRKTAQPSKTEPLQPQKPVATANNTRNVQNIQPPQQHVPEAEVARAHSHDEFDDAANDIPDDVNEDEEDDEEEMMVISPESESFQTRAQKRLSGIQEVTEMTYDEDDYDEGDIVDNEDFMEEPILNPLGISKAIPTGNQKHYKDRTTTPSAYDGADDNYLKPAFVDPITTTSSVSEDNFVEAQEEIVNDPPTVININNVNIPKSKSYQFANKSTLTSQQQASGAHSYRNLLYNENSKRSPIKNSIPQFETTHNDYANVNDDLHISSQQRDVASTVSSQPTSPVNYQSNNFSNFDQLEDNLYASTSNVTNSNTALPNQTRKLKLKSALKNSSSSLSSPVSESNPQFAKHVPQTNNVQRNPSQMRKSVSTPAVSSVPQKTLTPEEMYALALKAAEKKVYGSRLNDVYPDNDIDDDTKLNTIANMHANPTVDPSATTPVPLVTSMNEIEESHYNSGVSHPGLPYQSNAAGLGFRVHSLRDATSSTNARHSTNMTPQETGRFKKLFKYEQKAKKKQWEEERKAATGSESNLVKMAQEKVEKEVNSMPISPQIELQRMQQEHDAKLELSKPETAAPAAAIQTGTVRQSVDQERTRVEPEGYNLQKQVTATESTYSTAASPASPSKLKLKMFRLGKKKLNSPEHPTHVKKASVVSQESVPFVTNRRTSVDGKKNKLFSFGFGNHEHRDADVAQEVNNVQTGIQTVETAAPISEINVNQEAKAVEPTFGSVTPTISSTAVATETVVTTPVQPVPVNIDTIPEAEVIEPTLVKEVTVSTGEESFAQPNALGFKSHDNFVRGPHGSSSNLLKTGTNGSTVGDGFLYSNGNQQAPTSNGTANVTQPIAAPIHNASEVPSSASAELPQTQKVASNVSSSGRKGGKAGAKTGKRFMKFFNL